ncbi:TBC1 domain family member 25 [Rhodnius prolixus]|uniref:TBC1 domain family member 25 n=1 Tax=Rhodnius prolixus TaxID=13249 RepID=UPI003D18DBA7
MKMATVFGYKREAIRVKVMKCEGILSPEYRKFSVDPQITSYEVLLSLLAKAFDIKGDFTVCYKVFDDYGQETYLPLLSDWDLDAAFLSASEPYLCLRVDARPFEESCEIEEPVALVEAKSSHGIPGFIMNHVEKTFNMVQRALNLTEDTPSQISTPPVSAVPPRSPLMDAEFRQFLDPIGQVINGAQLRSVIYYGGIDPSLRKVVWKHILNVYPEGMSGKERMDYMKRKSNEYIHLRDCWREMLKNGNLVGDLAYVTSMVRKDVLRTDRHHMFYAGSDDNKNIASLFNILTTYALNHPAVSYCQGMSDLASPLLVTMNDEAHAYICFCALMKRLAPNFLLDGITMTKRFQHLADGLQYYDCQFYNYLKSYQADDLLFCYRWLLLEMKREFAFDDALRMLEVMWSSLPPAPPQKELALFEQEFMRSPPVPSPRPKENAYTKICALRRHVNHYSSSLDETGRKPLIKSGRPFTSLDDSSLKAAMAIQAQQQSSDSNPGDRSGGDNSPNSKATRIVRNLNEFLSLKEKNRTTNSFSNTNVTEQQDGTSPDDASNYFPITTSVTRELKLDLENLERHVFGDTDSAVNECGEAKITDNEVFVWENPLGTGEAATTPEDSLTGEVFETEGGVVKSITPIKVIQMERTPTKQNSHSSSNKTYENSLLERRRVTLEELRTVTTNGESTSEGSSADGGTTLVNEPNKQQQTGTPGSGITLPPPGEFGGGNPFLMFLCITVLTQHREPIMTQRMDYNEMAIHFDKMVRKHDVTKVLNQARNMYESYLKQYNNNPAYNHHLKV